MRDTRTVNEAFVKFKLAEFAGFYFGMVGVVCGIVEYEISYGTKNGDTKWRQIILLSIGLMMSCFLVVSIFFRYLLHLEWYKNRSEHDTLINTGYWKQLLMEAILCMIQPLPFIWDIEFTENNSDYDTKVTY